ncbi:MAG: hypothetical protein ACTSSQ_09005 [Alphaproteobacteria bacterium]
MRAFSTRSLAIAVALFVTTLAVTPASAGGEIGAESCSSSRTVSQIIKRFAWAERRTWHRGYEIVALHAPRFRYNVLNGPTAIRHTHCAATAEMSNGARRKVYYVIAESMGFASIGTGIDFCLPALDPWRVHDSSCRTVR